MCEKGINVEVQADVVGTEMEGTIKMLKCLDGRLFAFDEAIWCTQVMLSSAWLNSKSCIYGYWGANRMCFSF